MDLLISLLAVVAAVGLFDLAAVRFGVDSRHQVDDNHRRDSEGGH